MIPLQAYEALLRWLEILLASLCVCGGGLIWKWWCTFWWRIRTSLFSNFFCELFESSCKIIFYDVLLVYKCLFGNLSDTPCIIWIFIKLQKFRKMFNFPLRSSGALLQVWRTPAHFFETYENMYPNLSSPQKNQNQRSRFWKILVFSTKIFVVRW